jgi:hypothetical protein
MKRLSDEEERDRQQLQITRRRFFFLGFGAAAAAATRKLLPRSEFVPAEPWPYKWSDLPGLHGAKISPPPGSLAGVTFIPPMEGESYVGIVHPAYVDDVCPGAAEALGIDLKQVRIGEYADYLNTGLWKLNEETGVFEPPPDLTPRQARDAELVFGLRRDS